MIDNNRGRGHDLCLQFFKKVRSFTSFDRRSGFRSVLGIRPTCQSRCPPLPPAAISELRWQECEYCWSMPTRQYLPWPDECQMQQLSSLILVFSLYADTLYKTRHIPRFICISATPMTLGRILGRKWDKSIKSFAPCNSQSPLH